MSLCCEPVLESCTIQRFSPPSSPFLAIFLDPHLTTACTANCDEAIFTPVPSTAETRQEAADNCANYCSAVSNTMAIGVQRNQLGEDELACLCNYYVEYAPICTDDEGNFAWYYSSV